MQDSKRSDPANHKNPLVSIIVPVYNVELYLNRCIRSILKQTYKNFELVLINDGSDDNSGSICDYFLQIDNRVIVEHQANKGQSLARNKGINIANGEYISFIDSDDWIKPAMIEEMVAKAISYKLNVVECDIETSIENRVSEKKDFIPEFQIETREKALERIIKNEKFSACRRIYARKLLSNITFQPNKVYEDTFFTIDILKSINTLGYIRYPYYVYFIENPSSTMRGDYNLKKFNSIDVGKYVFNETLGLNSTISRIALNYWQKSLIFHYESLFRFSELDLDLEKRKNIKKQIKDNFYKTQNNIYSFLISLLPLSIYGVFIKVNDIRIGITKKLFY